MRYMLLIYGEESQQDEAAAEPAPMLLRPRSCGRGARDLAALVEYTNWLLREGIHTAGERLAGSSSATTVRVRDGNRLITDGPYAETKEVLGGYYIIECDDLDKALEAAARCPAAPSAGRSRSGRSSACPCRADGQPRAGAGRGRPTGPAGWRAGADRRQRGHRAGLPRGVRQRPGDADPLPRRRFRRRGGSARRRLRHRAGDLAARRHPGQPGRLADDRGPQSRPGPDPARPPAGREARPAGAGTDGHGGGPDAARNRGRARGRSSPPHLHLLPSGAAARTLESR